MTESDWQPLEPVDVKLLASPIAQVHRGAQFISMIGKHFVVNESDDSHTNMEWLAAHQVLAGRWVTDGNAPLRLAIRPRTLDLVFFDENFNAIDEFSLNGNSKDSALAWARDALSNAGLKGENLMMDLHYDIPHHETDDGMAFQLADQPLFDSIVIIRSNADLILREAIRGRKTASEVRIWPHHFDTGSYIPVGFDESGAATRSFSIGYAIPDGAIDEPYFYVTAWSAGVEMDYANLPDLSEGEWLHTPFHGAILRMSSILAVTDRSDQGRLVSTFLEEAIDASLELLAM